MTIVYYYVYCLLREEVGAMGGRGGVLFLNIHRRSLCECEMRDVKNMRWSFVVCTI